MLNFYGIINQVPGVQGPITLLKEDTEIGFIQKWVREEYTNTINYDI